MQHISYSDTLHSNKDSFAIAQISDLHLSEHDPKSFERFLAVLDLTLTHQPDLLLLTGDLVNDGVSKIYDWLFTILKNTSTPFLCLAGNHDVTQEIGHDLPFDERTFHPIAKDERLIDTHRLVIQMPHATWQILAVNSAVNGQIYGRLDGESLDFLKTNLSHQLPTLIAMHHHPHPVHSAWIDEYMLQNHTDFWQVVSNFNNIHAIVCGHVHQAHTINIHNHSLLTCPATSRQFLPNHDDFAIDEQPAGFRLIALHDDHTLDTQIHRIAKKMMKNEQVVSL